jgi:hypothetical protein
MHTVSTKREQMQGRFSKRKILRFTGGRGFMGFRNSPVFFWLTPGKKTRG